MVFRHFTRERSLVHEQRRVGSAKRPTSAAVGRNVREKHAKSDKARTLENQLRIAESAANRGNLNAEERY
jgi:hypothetical protein